MKIAKNDNTRKQILYEEIQKESYGLKLISLYLYIKCTIYALLDFYAKFRRSRYQNSVYLNI